MNKLSLFTVQTLLLEKKATVYIPPFLQQRESFTKEECTVLVNFGKKPELKKTISFSTLNRSPSVKKTFLLQLEMREHN